MREETKHDNTGTGLVSARAYADSHEDDARPIYPHECPACIYVGAHRESGLRYDLYLCASAEGDSPVSVVLRRSSEADNWSRGGLHQYPAPRTDGVTGRALARAARLAHGLGLIPVAEGLAPQTARLAPIYGRLIPAQLLPALKLLALLDRPETPRQEVVSALDLELDCLDNEAGITPGSRNTCRIFFHVNLEQLLHYGKNRIMAPHAAEALNGIERPNHFGWLTQTEYNLRCDASGREPRVLLRSGETLPAVITLTEREVAPPPAVITSELELTRRRILDDPSLLDVGAIGRCVVGLTLSRLVGRELTVSDKHQVPHLALAHLGLRPADLDRLYRIGAWPEDLRLRWHDIPARREWENHPSGHLADDNAERRARAEIAATLISRFVTTADRRRRDDRRAAPERGATP